MTETLKSFVMQDWVTGSGNASTLVNPSTEEVLATASTGGIKFNQAVEFSKTHGGPALRKMTFAERGTLLAALAKTIVDNRDALIDVSISNAGTTRSDAKFDIDGAIGTLNHYAEMGTKLGSTTHLASGSAFPIGRSARLYGQHILTPRTGVAVHINAFNFPAWGMAEKLAVAFLAGMPVISKPATSTALLAHRIAELWSKLPMLPKGTFSFICGSLGDTLSHLTSQDVVAFTGSSDTALTIRSATQLLSQSVHVNVEADSLNSAILGRDVALGSETLNMFLNDVAKEITQKCGQKCTATRRIYVAQSILNDVREMLVERLKAIKVGNPTDEKTNMGPVATAQQLKDVRAGIERLAQSSSTACGGSKPVEGFAKGYFVSPTLFVRDALATSQNDAPNAHEVFGPVATLMPYNDQANLLTAVAAGGGGLVASLYSDDKTELQQLIEGIAPYFGRLTLSNEKVAGQTLPPGAVLPSLLHGGPGRAGGGEELGGEIGLGLYMQRTALQAPKAIIDAYLPSQS